MTKVTVHIGLEDEMYMAPCVLHTDDLETWSDKPWSKKPFRTVMTSHMRQLAQPSVTFRTTDQYHNVPSRWSSSPEQYEQDRENPDDANHFLHEAPPSTQNLFEALQAEGVVTGPRLTENLFLRSWMIHHVHSPQCFQYRVIEITGRWRLWYRDILHAWRDRLLPDEEAIFDVVWPDPPRTGDHHEFIFDLIVSQGLEAPRRAGLITVLRRNDLASRASYAVACSLPEQVRGFQIVQSAEYLHGCQRYQCSIRHGWQNIPFTMEPVHLARDGDSFIVSVSDRQNEQAASSTSQAQNADNIDCPEPQSGQEGHDMEEDSDVPSPSLADSV